MKRATAFALAIGLAGCSNGDKPKQAPRPTPGSAATNEPLAECKAYKAALDQLATCAQIDQKAKDSLQRSYDESSAYWSNPTPEQRASVATSCKAGVDAVTAAGKTSCGW